MVNQEQFDKATTEALKNFDQAIKVTRENLDAVNKSTQIATKGAEQISTIWFDLARNSMEKSAEMTRAMIGAKDIREVTELQSEYARTGFDELMAEATKVQEVSVKVANEVMEPITGRLNEAAKSFKA